MDNTEYFDEIKLGVKPEITKRISKRNPSNFSDLSSDKRKRTNSKHANKSKRKDYMLPQKFSIKNDHNFMNRS